MPTITTAYDLKYDKGECVVFEHHGRMRIGVIEKLGYIDHGAGETVWYPIRTSVAEVCDYRTNGGDVCEDDIYTHPAFTIEPGVDYHSTLEDIKNAITEAEDLEHAFSSAAVIFWESRLTSKYSVKIGDLIVYAEGGNLFVGRCVGTTLGVVAENSDVPAGWILQEGCGHYSGCTFRVLPIDCPWILMVDMSGGAISECFDAAGTLKAINSAVVENKR